jgi:very-short-patch-repair endonuclease
MQGLDRLALRRAARVAACARHMRLHPTASEQVLFEALRGRRLGAAFRRQVPVGQFIADLVAPKARLIIELDGGYHAGRVAADARRDAVLQRLGFRVLHLDADRVMRDLEGALAEIRAALSESE